MFYVAAGELTVDLDGAAHEVTTGAVVHVPAGTVHRYRATSTERTRLPVLVTGGTQVSFLRKMGALGSDGKPDQARVAEHTAAHGWRTWPVTRRGGEVRTTSQGTRRRR